MTGEFFKISAVILIALGICVFLKSYRPEYSFLLAVSVSLIVLAVIMAKVYPSINTLKEIYYQSSGNQSNFGILIKTMVISYIAGFCSDTCRDFGQTALAQKVELAGRCAIFILTMPLLITILKTAMGFVNI